MNLVPFIPKHECNYHNVIFLMQKHIRSKSTGGVRIKATTAVVAPDGRKNEWQLLARDVFSVFLTSLSMKTRYFGFKSFALCPIPYPFSEI